MRLRACDMRRSCHESMLNLLTARNGDPAILNRTGGMQCGDALEGNVRQIRWGYCELLSQGHQNMRGPGTTLVIGKRIAPRCGLQMETPAHAIGVRLDPTLKTGLAAEIHAAVSFRVCRVGHEHEQAWGHLTAIGKRPAFGRSMTDNHYAKWQEGLWHVCTLVQAQEVAGCFFGAEPSRGALPIRGASARALREGSRRRIGRRAVSLVGARALPWMQTYRLRPRDGSGYGCALLNPASFANRSVGLNSAARGSRDTATRCSGRPTRARLPFLPSKT